MTSRALVASTAAIVILAAGCAKTPATTGASAPAPTGTAGTSGMSAAPARAATAGATRGTTGPGRADVAGFKTMDELRDVYFDFDKYEIRPDAARTLDTNAAWLRDNRRHLILIEGHCDERGTVEYNIALGERRAKATQNYLTAQGIDASRISIVSYGKERPQCSESIEACWAKNRRARLLVKAQ